MRGWVRLALPATGVAGTVVFFLVAFSPNLPMYGDSLNDWGRWAATHHADARHAVAILLLAYLLFMIFGVYVATLIGRNEPSTRLLVQIATVAIGVKFAIEMVQVAVLNVGTEVAAQDFNRSMAQLGTELSVLSLVPFATFLLAVGGAALISQAVPAWLAWFTLTVGAIHAFAMVLGFTGPPPLGPALMAFGLVWFASIPLWPLVTSVTLIVVAFRRDQTASAPAGAAQPA
jgi:hypothetical protein